MDKRRGAREPSFVRASIVEFIDPLLSTFGRNTTKVDERNVPSKATTESKKKTRISLYLDVRGGQLKC